MGWGGRGKTIWCLSGKRYIDGKDTHYPSRMEANVHRWLVYRRDVLCELSEVEYQPASFSFDAEWIDAKGVGWRKVGNHKARAVKRGHTKYCPDFRVKDSKGKEWYIEVIGQPRPDHKTRLERMGRFYPQVAVQVIGGKEYREISKIGRVEISGWEEADKGVSNGPRNGRRRTLLCSNTDGANGGGTPAD